MAYFPLKLDPSTPAAVEVFVRKAIEALYLSDVHGMLRLPLPHERIEAGQNFAATQVLMGVIAGVSTILFQNKGESGDLFKGLVEEFFPWDEEPTKDRSKKASAAIVYDVFRNPLTHSAGLMMNWQNNTRFLVQKQYVVKLKRLLANGKISGHSEDWLERFESSASRPSMGPTLTVQPHKRVLLVEGLYWGTRRMIEKLSADAPRMQSANRLLMPHLTTASTRPGASKLAHR